MDFSQKLQIQQHHTRYIFQFVRTTKNHQKWPKTDKNAENLVLMGSYHKNSGKSCLERVLGHFGAKSINKKKFFVFAPKKHDFSKKNFKRLEIPFFDPGNLVGCVFHEVLMIN